MDCQFLFHWSTQLFTYYEDISKLHKIDTSNEIKSSLENLWQQTIQLSDFFTTHWCLFSSVCLEVTESAAGRVVLFQLMDMYMRTCYTHHNDNHSVANIYGISGIMKMYLSIHLYGPAKYTENAQIHKHK